MKLVSAFGTSTPFAYWGFSLIGMVVDHLYGPHHRIHCLTLEDFAVALDQRQDRNVLFTSDIPQATLVDALIRARAPMIVFLDEPEDAIAFASYSRDMDVREAIAFNTMCFCALHDVLEAPWALVFRTDTYGQGVRDVFARILVYLEGEASDTTLDALMGMTVERHGPDHLLSVADRIESSDERAKLPGKVLGEMPEADQRLIGRIGAGYRPIFDRRPIGQVEWPRELLSAPAPKGESVASAAIPIRGGGRFLIGGPYHYLPIGRWVARVEFEVEGNLSGNHLQVDVARSGDPLVTLETELPVRGIYAYELAFDNETRSPLEMRIRLMKGAIEGQLLIVSCTLRPQKPAPKADSPLPGTFRPAAIRSGA